MTKQELKQRLEPELDKMIDLVLEKHKNKVLFNEMLKSIQVGLSMTNGQSVYLELPQKSLEGSIAMGNEIYVTIDGETFIAGERPEKENYPDCYDSEREISNFTFDILSSLY